MKVNIKGLQDLSNAGPQPAAAGQPAPPKKLQFMVITKWGNAQDRSTYREEAFALRRSYDALQWTENQFNSGKIVMMHKAATAAMTFQLVAVDNHEELNAFLKESPAHNRYESREVVPMCDWDSGRADFVGMIKRFEQLAKDEDAAMASNSFRPVP